MITNTFGNSKSLIKSGGGFFTSSTKEAKITITLLGKQAGQKNGILNLLWPHSESETRYQIPYPSSSISNSQVPYQPLNISLIDALLIIDMEATD